MRIDKEPVAASATPLGLGILSEGGLYGYPILKRVPELVPRMSRCGQNRTTLGTPGSGLRRGLRSRSGPLSEGPDPFWVTRSLSRSAVPSRVGRGRTENCFRVPGDVCVFSDVPGHSREPGALYGRVGERPSRTSWRLRCLHT